MRARDRLYQSLVITAELVASTVEASESEKSGLEQTRNAYLIEALRAKRFEAVKAVEEYDGADTIAGISEAVHNIGTAFVALNSIIESDQLKEFVAAHAGHAAESA
ncbi:hypothetical protein LTR04_006601 [Oleoguttula sp. CCFEE 6159]|nr:hypothetical protein LTR04_006601 [Oleoguttula sp. CCFEE 6159]